MILSSVPKRMDAVFGALIRLSGSDAFFGREPEFMVKQAVEDVDDAGMMHENN